VRKATYGKDGELLTPRILRHPPLTLSETSGFPGPPPVARPDETKGFMTRSEIFVDQQDANRYLRIFRFVTCGRQPQGTGGTLARSSSATPLPAWGGALSVHRLREAAPIQQWSETRNGVDEELRFKAVEAIIDFFVPLCIEREHRLDEHDSRLADHDAQFDDFRRARGVLERRLRELEVAVETGRDRAVADRALVDEWRRTLTIEHLSRTAALRHELAATRAEALLSRLRVSERP
jgi:hypothetical protein